MSSHRPSAVGGGPSRQFALELGPVHPAAREIALAMDLERNAAFITSEILEIVFPDRLDDGDFRELMSRNAYDNLKAMWRIIAGLDELEVNPPQGAIEFNDNAAAIGVPLGQFERIYRVGVGLVWTLWFQAAAEYSATHGVELGPLLAGPSMIIHAYIDVQISTLLERYEIAHAEHQRTREQLQLTILRQVLEGPPVPSGPDIGPSLGIPLDAEHVAVAIRIDALTDDTPLAKALRDATGAPKVLAYRHAPAQWVVWLSRTDGFDVDRICALHEVLTRSGLRCAIADGAWGLPGLTTSGGEALEAARLQDKLGPAAQAVVSFDELRLESLLLSDPVKARRFVRAELRALDAEDARHASLRDTAQTWLTCGSNVSTAQILGVHEHTVRNRITTIQELIGRPLTTRRTELLVALRLRRMLDVTL